MRGIHWCLVMVSWWKTHFFLFWLYDNTVVRLPPCNRTLTTMLHSYTDPGPCPNIKSVFSRYGIPMLKIRRSQDRLIFNMRISIPARRYLYIEMPPRLYNHNNFYSDCYLPCNLLIRLSWSHLVLWNLSTETHPGCWWGRLIEALIKWLTLCRQHF